MQITDLAPFGRFIGRTDVKVLRHKETNPDLELWHLFKRGRFQEYQEGQGRNVFGEAKYIISFIAERNSTARFVGVWEVLSKEATSKGFQYKTRQVEGFEELIGRLIVDFPAPRKWDQLLHSAGNKRVLEILPPNYVADFPGFYEVKITFDELVAITSAPQSHREWERMLSSVSGVYLILDVRSGKQYVGSAYGKAGIWARWCTYARSPSGGNKLLAALLDEDHTAHHSFQFSILRVLESGATKDEVVQHESLVKQKLGSRAFGLNDN